jgi:hypothetical protein
VIAVGHLQVPPAPVGACALRVVNSPALAAGHLTPMPEQICFAAIQEEVEWLE